MAGFKSPFSAVFVSVYSCAVGFCFFAFLFRATVVIVFVIGDRLRRTITLLEAFYSLLGVGVSLAYMPVFTGFASKVSFVSYSFGFGARYYLFGHCQKAILLKLTCTDHSRDFAGPVLSNLASPFAI